MIREKTINKFQAALEDLELQCRMGSKITHSEFADRHSITRSFVFEAKEIGIISKTGKFQYDWKWGSPNRALAKRIINQINTGKNSERHQKKSEESCQPIKRTDEFYIPAQFKRETRKRKPQKSVESVSWFWGLYRKTITT
jgi:hypothetical protein|tara:strand:- start:519 stop:941 length:423 start_codon:yes stop_codon:yes gene_type:complete